MTTSESSLPSIEQITAWANEFFRTPQAPLEAPPPSAADAPLNRAAPAPSADLGGVQPAMPNLPPYYPNLPQASLPNVLPVFPNVSQPTVPVASALPASVGVAQPAIPQLPPFYPALPQPSSPYVAPIPPAVSQPVGLNQALPFATGLAQPSFPGATPFYPAPPQPSLPFVAPIAPAVSQPTAAGLPNSSESAFSSFGQPAIPQPMAAPAIPDAPYFDGFEHTSLAQPMPSVPSTASSAQPNPAPPTAASVPGTATYGHSNPQPSYSDYEHAAREPIGANDRHGEGSSLYFLRAADPAHRNAKSTELLDPYAKPDRNLARVDSFERDPRAESARQDFEPTRPPQQYDVEAIRGDFPILRERVQGRPLVWLDNAATTQKPQVVIDRISEFYMRENSNIHRAAHTLAARATDAYEAARQSVRRFLNASSAEEIVFVRGTTEGINLIAQTWGKRYIEAGDEIIISHIEHHSNIVPWQMLCQQTGAKLRVAPVDDSGQILLEEYERLFTSRTRLVSFTQVSNALGTVLPVNEMVQIAHRYGARAVVDGAQAVCHMPVDVQALDCDFYVFSGHKVFGPTGIGVVYAKKALLDAMPPYQGGGNMIGDVTFEKTVYQPPPMRFEAGTGNIADAVGLGSALDYLQAIGLENVNRHEHALLEYGIGLLREIPRLRLIGTAREKAAVMGFVLEDVPTEQVGAALASEGIAVRAGHHCAQPALRRFGVETTVRPSLALYNNRDDIDALVTTLKRLQTRWLR